MLLFPIDIPQLEKWVSFVKGLPQDFKILFRVANAHGNADLNAEAPPSLISEWNIGQDTVDTPKEDLSPKLLVTT